MNKPTKFLWMVAIVYASSFFVFAQATKTPVEWNALKLDVSTPENAITLFGKPLKDKDKVSLREEYFAVRDWLSKKYSEKVFRDIEYKSLQGYTKVRLAFLESKLIAIILESPNALNESKYVDPDDVGTLFPIKFKPLKLGLGRKTPSLENFQSNSPDELKKDEYDYWYDMIGVADNCFIAARVDNYKYIEGLFDRHKAEHKRRKEIDANGKFPGFVTTIQIISRTLELK